MAVEHVIQEIVSRIVEKFDPEKLILFGSCARNSSGPDSDIDLLVVMPFKSSRRKLGTEIDLALLGIDMPVDVVVITPQELERDLDRIGTIVQPAMSEGRILYERAA